MNKILILLLLALVACSRSTPSVHNDTEKQINDSTSINADSSRIKPAYSVDELTSFFNKQKLKDGFLVQPKNLKTDGDEVYCYFVLKDNKASDLRLRIQFWETAAQADCYSFDVDGKITVYNANRNKSQSGNIRVVESAVFRWFDNSINKEDYEFLESLSEADTVKITLISSSSNSVVSTMTLSDNVKKSIGRTLSYYLALNGAKIPKKGMVNIRG